MANAPRFTILLVEDNDGDAELVTAHITALGAEDFGVTRATTLTAALAALAGTSFDIVLLDLVLPDSEAMNTVRAVCEGAARTSPIVLILTSLDDQEVAKAAMADCAEDYLIKSEMSPAALLRNLRVAVQRHGRRRVEAMEAQGKTHKGDGAEARKILRRANRIAETGSDDARPLGDIVQSLATASRASEIVFTDVVRKLDAILIERKATRRDMAELLEHARKQDEQNHASDIERLKLRQAMRGLRQRLNPLIQVFEGDPAAGHSTLRVRLERLEGIESKYQESAAERARTFRQIFVAIAPHALLAIGGAVVGFFTWYVTQRFGKK